MNNDTLKKFAVTENRDFVLTDHPYRENRNYVDQLMMRAKEYSCSEHLKFFIIGEYVLHALDRPKPEKTSHKGFIKTLEPFINRKSN
jgi:hypothetical protein